MRVVIFTHSLVSDWNHGNAHFLRGVGTELVALGHDLRIFEPRHGWSLSNLLNDQGTAPLADFARAYPDLSSTLYEEDSLDLGDALDDADLVLVHEWNSHDLVRRIGLYRASNPTFRLFFHDTHHRIVTAPESIASYDLTHYDGVLAYGGVIRDLYRERGLAPQAWTWHEAADTRVFRPLPTTSKTADLVWVGNWGDDERSGEIREFLIQPVRDLQIKARVYGVRYPADALEELSNAGIEYGGWLPNFRVPEVFAEHRVTVHIPRRPYASALPGIPTIRPFEALACGLPLVSAPWQDSEPLFRGGVDYLIANNRGEMTRRLADVLGDAGLAGGLAERGLETIRARHTCAHRAGELMQIAQSIGVAVSANRGGTA